MDQFESKIVLTKSGNPKTIYKTRCLMCQKEIWRPLFSIKHNKKLFCWHPAYCKYEYLHKIRDPKSYNILQHKDSPNFYYLIGLICTDGNITYPIKIGQRGVGYSCYINLNKKDKEIINKIQNIFGGQSQLMHDNTIRWWISNKHFIDYLKNMGLTHNKSKNLDIKIWFDNLNEINKKHFLRGVIDGDGCIKSYKKDHRFNICSGSPNFYSMLKEHFIKTYGTLGLTESHHPTYSYIECNNINMLKILNDIYDMMKKGKTILYMKRKYREYKNIKNFYKTYNKNKDYRYRNQGI